MRARRALLAGLLAVIVGLGGLWLLPQGRTGASTHEEANEAPAPDLAAKQARAAALIAVQAAERYLASGELVEAMREGERAHQLAPAMADPHRVLAATHKRAGRPDQACAHMQRYIEKASVGEPGRARLLSSACE